jgi:hypothetical protein
MLSDHELALLSSISAFSREGVIRNVELDNLILRKLVGHSVDLGSFDRREIMFHMQQLCVAGLASGTWSGNGSYIFEFTLNNITEKGAEVLSRITDAKKAESRATIYQQFYGSVQMGDKYSVSGQGNIVNSSISGGGGVKQSWNQGIENVDFDTLSKELKELRIRMRSLAVSVEDDQSVVHVGAAEKAAGAKNGSEVMENLKAAGRYALDVAKEMGKTLAVTAIEHAMGPSSGA